MTIETWLAFTLATIIILMIPGPTILLVVSYALGYGRKTAVSTATGVALGDFTAMTASMLGLGALLATSADIFMFLRWVGGAYLIYLGIKLWRAPLIDGPIGDNDNLPERAPLRVMAHAFVVTALNPKSIVFFVAFAPQFLNAESAFLPQMVTMEATFVVLAAINALGYAMLADFARGYIRKASVQRTINRTGGTLLISAGTVTAIYSKAA